GGRDLAFACFTLSRRHCSAPGTTVGDQFKRVGDLFVGRILSLLHLATLVLDRFSLSIRPYRHRCWSHSRLARFGDDSLGDPTRRTFLHPEPLARIYHRVSNRSTFRVRLVARHALGQQRDRRSALAARGVRNPAFPVSRHRIDRLLSDLFHRSSSATHAP